VDADGGSCQTTLILNDKIDFSKIENFAPIEIDVKFM
jgi:hypothetical protein